MSDNTLQDERDAALAENAALKARLAAERERIALAIESDADMRKRGRGKVIYEADWTLGCDFGLSHAATIARTEPTA